VQCFTSTITCTHTATHRNGTTWLAILLIRNRIYQHFKQHDVIILKYIQFNIFGAKNIKLSTCRVDVPFLAVPLIDFVPYKHAHG
jgi:hypothetical protein